MNFYEQTYELMRESSLTGLVDQWAEPVMQKFDPRRFGDLPKWLAAYDSLPDVKPSAMDLNSDAVQIGTSDDIDLNQREVLELLFRQLLPWRKGPFDIFGMSLDTEWRSDYKWNRLKKYITPLNGRYVLDVGCGNGYHLWRMLGAGAKMAIGVDPTMLYVMQFQFIQRYMQNYAAAVLPLGIDDLADDIQLFDTVFSMGLLYHRRSPYDHLLKLKSLLRDSGELVLDTLVIEGKSGEVLSPEGRYAKMKNVWFIPSVKTLEGWLKRSGYKNICLVDVNRTTFEEQRVTNWIGSQSLADFLDPQDPRLTAEGYPAPIRAVVLAEK